MATGLAFDVTAGAVKAQIEKVCTRRNKLNMRRIDVNVRNGTVMLNGNVPSYEARYEVAQLVRTIPGVSSVVNQLIVD
jgi:osmotically-inducible protein OsmY